MNFVSFYIFKKVYIHIYTYLPQARYLIKNIIFLNII